MITSINPQISGGHTWKVFHAQQRCMKGPVPVLKKRPRCSVIFRKLTSEPLASVGMVSSFSNLNYTVKKLWDVLLHSPEILCTHQPKAGRRIWNVADVPKVIYKFCNLIHPKQRRDCQQKIRWPKADYLHGILDLIELNPPTVPRPVLIRYRHFWLGFRYSKWGFHNFYTSRVWILTVFLFSLPFGSTHHAKTFMHSQNCSTINMAQNGINPN